MSVLFYRHTANRITERNMKVFFFFHWVHSGKPEALPFPVKDQTIQTNSLDLEIRSDKRKTNKCDTDTQDSFLNKMEALGPHFLRTLPGDRLGVIRRIKHKTNYFMFEMVRNDREPW